MTTTNINNLAEELSQFIGTEKYYKISLIPALVTDGVKYLADTYECYWLTNTILIYLHPIYKKQGDLYITLSVNKNHVVTITAKTLDTNEIVLTKKIKDTCKLIPTGEVTLYLMQNILLLSTEY